MMPTLEQIKKLNQLLLDLYMLDVTPTIIQFSRRGIKPFVILYVEPIHDIKEPRWYQIDWEGNLI